MQSTAADPLVGQVLEGRYRVLQRLAHGGMSTVYAGMDDRLDREVAIKVMTHSLSADPVFVDRFAREARAAAKLSHVNAVSVYDQGSDAGNVFLVMELVRGRTLRDLIRERGRLSPAEAVSLMEPVLAALAAAHRAGLMHRDVKPENILLSDEGVVKVADFGLARAVVSDGASTRTGLMMGTVAYSSPEQFRGSSVDIRSDVYSAGIVLFELLTGHPPYQGPDAMSVAYQHVHSDVPAPSSRQAGIAAPIDRLVRRVTARDPALRPPDAGAFLAELDDVRRELRLPVLPVPRRPRPSTPARPGSLPAAENARTRPSEAHTNPDPRRAAGVQHTMVAPSGPTPPVRPSADDSGRRPRRWLRTMIGALVLLLVCAGLITGSWWWASGRYSSIADVRDQSVAAATAALKDQGYKVVTDPAVASETVLKGLIIATEPPTGNRLPRGRTVHLVPSSGPTYFAIPSVSGKAKSVADAALAGLKLGGVSVTYGPPQASDTVPANSVISTNPVAGTQVRRGQTIVVTLSSGLPILSVPDVKDKPQKEAEGTLEAAGFRVSTTLAFSDDVDSGQVISETPAGGAKLRKFSPVTLVVSKGQDLVQVPDETDLVPVDTARSQLEGLGFQVKVQSLVGGGHGLVYATDPNPGKKIKRGSTVTLYVV